MLLTAPIRRVRPSILLLFLALPGGAAPAAALGMAPIPLKPAASSPPQIVFEPDAVLVSGLGPEAQVFLHGVSRYHDAYYWALVPTDEMLTADESGSVRYEVPDGVAPFSVWAAVDAATGELAIASPEGSIGQEVPFPADGLDQTPGAVVSRLHTTWERAEVLFVRPGVGAWRGIASRGGRSSPTAAGAAVDLASALPIQAAPAPPAALVPGDVVMAVNLDTLDYFAARLTPPGQQP